MKKYTAFVIFIFIACLFSSSPQSVNADVVVGGPGCTPGAFYSVTTGKPCRSWSSCNPGDLYDWVTGKPCKVAVLPPPTPLEACEIEVLPIWSRGDNVRMLQQKLKDEGFMPTSGKIDGIYGPITSAAATRYYKIRPCPKPFSSVVISGIKGPQSLKVGETGTWTVTAYDKSGGDLEYAVVWGDEVYEAPVGGHVSAASMIQYGQTATFTHTYQNSGIKQPYFSVRNSSGKEASTSLSVKVGINPPIPPNPPIPLISSITVTSPNGGEEWQKGTTKTIRWEDTNAVYPCLVAPCPVATYDIVLEPSMPPCTHEVCPMYMLASYTIARNVSGSSYTWTVGNVNSDYYLNNVSDEKYTIRICQSGPIGNGTCDSSDNYFKVTQ